MICKHEKCKKQAIGFTSVKTKDMKKAIKGTINVCQKHLKESCEYDT